MIIKLPIYKEEGFHRFQIKEVKKMNKVTKEVIKNHLFSLKNSIELAMIGNKSRQIQIVVLQEEIANANIRIAKYNREIEILKDDLARG